jgi:hypothetical protein
MADVYRAQVTVYSDTNPDRRDDAVNVLYFRKEAPFGSIADYDALAGDLASIYAARTFFGGVNHAKVRIYNMDDAKPRPIRGSSDKLITTVGSPGMREAAICLSFYADRNLPHKRGRIYLGPLNAASTGLDRPRSVDRDNVLAMGAALSGLGGIDIDWVVYSPTLSASEGGHHVEKVQHCWVDNEFDVQRRRGLRGTSRITADVSG